MVDDSVADMVQNGAFERFARFGYVVSGLLHIAIGYLAVRVAQGAGGDVDQSGALAEVAARRGGGIALWVAAGGFLAMALWRLAETVLGRSTDPKSQRTLLEVSDRLKALGLAAVYFALAWSTFGFARGTGESASEQNSTMSARLLQTTGGTIALILAGLVIVAVGGYHIFKGATRNFLDDLKGTSSSLVRQLGTVGYIGKGLAIVGTGVAVVVAAATSDPSRATGLDGALKSLAAQPFGPVLVNAAAVGIITYGLFSFAMARYTKM
ncbi:hypothetical protein BVC93_06720 [Mycobacterium sp. MS1601]|uniref:DUF1206 domain-containing protein n=1 Tax=Mycobacterium sp. MS1601 TaxID=1936029 RepID=UPI0009791F7B|nr:DUF1206 domain-containing protein [Mycobacterium sp. MS1601]AQA02172.1 hypothetical protein BVC93_06720 [Mycobacterium sp. MS1601]